MAFHGKIGGGAIGDWLVGKNIQQAASRHHLRCWQTGGLQKSRSDVTKIYQAIVDAASSADPWGPANGQRHMGPCIIETGLGTRERHAVVTGNHDNGVFQLTSFFQGLNRSGDHLVKVFDLDKIIEQVTSDDRMVGKDGGYNYLDRILPRPSPHPLLVTAMGFMRPQPETKRLPLRNLV